jgi:hypothetical protein
MTIQSNGTTSNSGAPASPPQNYNFTESYSTINVSSTTYKDNNTSIAPGESVVYTAWVLKDGTAVAVDLEGSNVTGSEAQGALTAAFAGFALQVQAAAINLFTASNNFHSTGTSTVSIGPTAVTVTTYAANTLPETVTNCGTSTTLTAYSFSVGTPQGTNSSLIVYERLAGSETDNGLTTFIDVTIHVTSITLASSSTTSTSSSASPWLGGPVYPLQADGGSGVLGQSCVNGTATIYCIGGIGNNGTFVDNVYSAGVSPSGMSGWTADAPYPQAVAEQSCISYQGYVYCVGGAYDNAGDPTASSYYAQLTSTGVGPWQQTTSYPVPIDSQSCVSSSGYIYCVAGENETDGTSATLALTNSDWYAQLTPSGIGTWKQTTSYPPGAAFPACAASATDIYCVGGFDANGNGLNNVYYAPLSSSGVGQWTSTTPYPIKLAVQYCAIGSDSMICVGGVPNFNDSASAAVYSASISGSGVGPWQQDANYPIGIETICTLASGNLYCTGGFSSNSDIWSDFTFYASVQSLLE